jgi:hypothetical protein
MKLDFFNLNFNGSNRRVAAGAHVRRRKDR